MDAEISIISGEFNFAEKSKIAKSAKISSFKVKLEFAKISSFKVKLEFSDLHSVICCSS